MIIPPIKSQGIKTKIVPRINELVDKIRTKDSVWVEPFLGTGVVAFNARIDHTVVNDTNPHIIRLYKDIASGCVSGAITRDYLTEEGQLLKDLGYPHYLEVRKRFNESPNSLDFIFLSRSCFNGIMRFNQSGRFNTPFCKNVDRFSKSYITKISNQVESVSKVINHDWIFCNESFEGVIEQYGTENSIIYCDPPYFGRNTNYYGCWSEHQEETLYKLLKRTPSKFILSTWIKDRKDENLMIGRFWREFNVMEIDHYYFVGPKVENRGSVLEALIYNF